VQGVKRDAENAVRAKLDEHAFCEAWNQGSRLTVDTAVNEALSSRRGEDR
jgi:hypothetical protein